MITSGGNSSSSCPYSFVLNSIRSGPFSWTRSAFFTAAGSSAVKVSFDWDAPGARPNLSSAGHASLMKRFRAASAFGATSVAVTSRPLARNSAAQLAPMTPVPMMAVLRMGLVMSDMVVSPLIECSDFRVGNAGEIALRVEKIALARPVEVRGIDGAREIGHEHPVFGDIEGDADPFHQMRDEDLRLGGLGVDGGAVHRIAAGRVAAFRPVEHAIFQIEFEVDRL